MKKVFAIELSGSVTSFLEAGFAGQRDEALLHQTPIEALRSDSIVSAAGRLTSWKLIGYPDAGVVKAWGLSKLIPVSAKLGSGAANTLTDSIRDLLFERRTRRSNQNAMAHAAVVDEDVSDRCHTRVVCISILRDRLAH